MKNQDEMVETHLLPMPSAIGQCLPELKKTTGEGGGRVCVFGRERKWVVLGEDESWKRKKEATAASSSAVTVSGGHHGGRREWTEKEKRGRSRERGSEAEGVYIE